MAGERCKRCHRKLKTPEAIEVGYGRACYKKMFGKALFKKNTHLICSFNKLGENQLVEGQISIFDKGSEV